MRWPQANSKVWRRGSWCAAALGFALALTAVSQKSVTVDEFQALPSGLAVWKTGDFRFPKGTPPLSQLLPAIPLLFTKVEPGPSAKDPELTSWNLGHDFAFQYRSDFPFYFFLGRLVSCFVFALMLWFVHGLAKNLYGERGAFLAVFLTAFQPMLLAHGPLITPDIYLAAAVAGFLWALDVFAQKPNARTAALLSLALATATLVKFTGLLLFGLLPMCLWALKTKIKKVGKLSWLAFAIALLTIHAGYAFQASLPLLGSFSFHSTMFAWAQAHLPQWIPLPLPFSFLKALDDQLSELTYQSYLLGKFSSNGFYLFYLVAFLVKSPVAILFLFPAAIVLGKRLEPRERPLVILLVFFFLFFSLGRYKNIGLRYLLFLLPLLAVWIARLAKEEAWKNAQKIVAAMGVLLLATTLLSWPHYLSYFNQLSGGSSNGHKYLLDSDLDWGQDLVGLKKFMAENNIPSLELAYFGRANPELYGISFTTLKETPTQRFVAVSANLVWGKMYFVNGSSYWPKDKDQYSLYRELRPIAVIGHSIYVFDRKYDPLRDPGVMNESSLVK